MKNITKSLRCLPAMMGLLLMITQVQAATLTVTKTADTNDGMCNLDCSLREAIGSSSANDTITFSVLFAEPQTISLNQGTIMINKTLTLIGPGSHLLAINGNFMSRIFTISGTNITATIRGVTVTGGAASGSGLNGDGGGILNDSVTVVLTDVRIANNSASSSGGGVYTDTSGNTTLTNCTVSNNVAAVGGGVYNLGLTTITSSSIHTNTSTSTSSGGGGLWNASQLQVFNSTITNNTSSGFFVSDLSGAGIRNTISGTLLVVSSTVSHNRTNASGGGISDSNSATIRNSIVATNTAGQDVDVDGSFSSLGNNLIGNATGSSGFSNNVNGDIVGTTVSPVDPRLGPLQNNGGQSASRAPFPDSPAIDRGNNCVAQPVTSGGCLANQLLFDQRGTGFPRLAGTSVDIGSVEVGITRSVRGAFDYDGDGRSDISIYRPSVGDWYHQRSRDGLFGIRFGLATDKIVPADFDGDGKTDVAVYRPSDGTWYIVRSTDGTFMFAVFGLANDIPVPGDFDGDGKADLSVFRPSDSTWYRLNSRDGSFFGRQFGASGDKPVMGDFDGDGKGDLAVFRPSNGVWYQIRSSDGSFFGEQFGIGDDKIVPADYDGDGKTDLAVYRASNGFWYIKRSQTAAFSQFQFGAANDIPAPGDFDGDGKADLSVFRPSDGNWYRTNSGNGSFFAFPFGINGDRPTQSAFQ